MGVTPRCVIEPAQRRLAVVKPYRQNGDTFAIDATALPAQQDDPDAVWALDEHSEDNFYYGYGLVAVVDCASGKRRNVSSQGRA